MRTMLLFYFSLRTLQHALCCNSMKYCECRNYEIYFSSHTFEESRKFHFFERVKYRISQSVLKESKFNHDGKLLRASSQDIKFLGVSKI